MVVTRTFCDGLFASPHAVAKGFVMAHVQTQIVFALPFSASPPMPTQCWCKIYLQRQRYDAKGIFSCSVIYLLLFFLYSFFFNWIKQYRAISLKKDLIETICKKDLIESALYQSLAKQTIGSQFRPKLTKLKLNSIQLWTLQTKLSSRGLCVHFSFSFFF